MSEESRKLVRIEYALKAVDDEASSECSCSPPTRSPSGRVKFDSLLVDETSKDYSLCSWAPQEGRWLDSVAEGHRERPTGCLI